MSTKLLSFRFVSFLCCPLRRVALAALVFKIAFLYLPLCVCLILSMAPGHSVLGFDKIPWWGTLLISLGFSLLTATVVWFIVCPRLKKKIARKLHYVSHFWQPDDSVFKSRSPVSSLKLLDK